MWSHLVIEGLAKAEAEEHVFWLGCYFWQKDFGFFHKPLKYMYDYDRDIVGSLVIVGHLREQAAGFGFVFGRVLS